jgi:hypothetical protein
MNCLFECERLRANGTRAPEKSLDLNAPNAS